MVFQKLRSAPSWATLIACCAAQFMVILDVTIVNVAVPQMRDDLGLGANGGSGSSTPTPSPSPVS